MKTPDFEEYLSYTRSYAHYPQKRDVEGKKERKGRNKRLFCEVVLKVGGTYEISIKYNYLKILIVARKIQKTLPQSEPYGIIYLRTGILRCASLISEQKG